MSLVFVGRHKIELFKNVANNVLVEMNVRPKLYFSGVILH